MIVFDLRCAKAHVFEAWFGSSDNYEEQRARGLLSCPVCGDADVGKALMAPAVAPKGNRRADDPAPTPAAAHDPEQVKAMLAALAEIQSKVEANCDYVGDRFADEARAIHLGESDARGVYGETTPAEAQALRDEGIEIAPLPFRPRGAADA
jgi:hypothetical protein